MYISLVCSLPFLYISFILSYTYYQFGNYQSQIHDLIVSNLDKNISGKFLDIGSGSGSLIIKLAKNFPDSQLFGINYWGSDWEYSKQQCENNANIEGVSDRIEFIKASASNLPFKENEFDAVVSCLTFHEVKDEKNKLKIINEALRVLNPNGKFVLLDLFREKKVFGEYNSFLHSLSELQNIKFEAINLESIIHLPTILKKRKVLGNAVILKGIKIK